MSDEMKPDKFKIPCGDWIFPSQDTTTRAAYPIEYPLVAEIFPSKSQVGKVASGGEIQRHLQGPRFVQVTLLRENAICLDSLGNSHEELFSSRIDTVIDFDPSTLARPNVLWENGEYKGYVSRRISNIREFEWFGVFFTSILLQAHLAGKTLSNGIVFRKATVPEIESLGTWDHRTYQGI